MYINIFRSQSENRLRKERSNLYGMRAAALSLLVARVATKSDQAEITKYETAFHELEIKIQKVESELLKIDAYYLGIEYPTKEDKRDWWTSNETESWLSEKGLIHLNKLVKDEKRKNMEWWITIFASLIGALTGFVGAVIALVAILHEFGRI